MTTQPILINGQWRAADASGTFQAENPATREPLPDQYPVSRWSDCEAALDAAAAAAEQLRQLPGEAPARFLEAFAEGIEARAEEIVALANQETGLPVSPRLAGGELPRTTGQLRQAAAAAREGSWALPTIDTANQIRSCYRSLGPVCVFGPNNFPLAFGSVSGGDFAAAIAAGNPVIGKANSSHPGTTRLFAEVAEEARRATDLPPGTVQLLYRLDHADGERLVADPRVGATGYTGSRRAGLALKAAADAAGKPIYLELSSINPVVILPGALQERGAQIADEFAGSCLMGAGQFCTNPGLVVLLDSPESETFIQQVAEKFGAAVPGTLLSQAVWRSLQASVDALTSHGARRVPVAEGQGQGYFCPNTLLRITAADFLAAPEAFQMEAFGNASLIVTCADEAQGVALLRQLEGNLTGCVYSASNGADDALYEQFEPHLRARVGRLLNDKMPTGVAVSPAMNHGGPYPATGHPGFTAVGIPASLLRFGMLQCYDGVRPHRLPELLRDQPANPATWRLVDGSWKQGPV